MHSCRWVICTRYSPTKVRTYFSMVAYPPWVEMIMVRCQRLTIAIRWQWMCSACTTPHYHPTAWRLMYMWRIVSVRFSSLPLVSTTSVRIARTNLHLRATKNITHSTSKRCTFLREVRHIVTETYELKNLPNHVNFSYIIATFAMSYQRFACFLNITRW